MCGDFGRYELTYVKKGFARLFLNQIIRVGVFDKPYQITGTGFSKNVFTMGFYSTFADKKYFGYLPAVEFFGH